MEGTQRAAAAAAPAVQRDDPSCWDLLDPLFFDYDDEDTSSNPCYFSANHSVGSGVDFDGPLKGCGGGDECAEKQFVGKRGRSGGCNRRGVKASRERLRRERLNDKFNDLSSILEPGRSVKTEKPAILDDAIKVLIQLRAESEELRETNEKLLDEINCLKAEKNELKEEKLALKEDKLRLEQQLKALAVPQAGFVPTHPATAYPPLASKVPVFPSYGYYPMWRFLPPSTCDTTADHELRPPAA